MFPSTLSNSRCKYRDCVADQNVIESTQKILNAAHKGSRHYSTPVIKPVESNELFMATEDQYDADLVLCLRQLGWTDNKRTGGLEVVYEYRHPRQTRQFGLWTIYRVLWYVMLIGLGGTILVFVIYQMTGFMFLFHKL